MYDNYKIITTEKELDKVIKYCKKTGYCSFDFETSGHEYHSPLGYPTIMGISFQPGSGFSIPLGHFDSVFKDKYQDIFKKISKELLENPKVIKVAWNAKFEYQWVKRLGGEIHGRFFDGMLAKYLLNEERPNDLKSMVMRYIPEYGGYETYEGSKLPWDQKPLEGLSQYCAMDCDMTLRLMIFFENQLIKNDFYKLFRNLLMMGTRVLAESEYMGFNIDKDKLAELDVKYIKLLEESDKNLRNHRKIKKFEKYLVEQRVEKLISKIEIEISEIEEELLDITDPIVIRRKEKSIQTRYDKIDRLNAHEFTTASERKVLEPVNFSSPQQMGELFFTSKKGFRFDIIKYTTDKAKNETDNPSTDESVLLELSKLDKSGFCKELLNYRGLSKLYGAFIKGIQERLGQDGKIHARYNLHQTVTGRLSSNDPNMQQIPRTTTNADIKTMFIPPKGYLLLQLDYSQAELRVMAAAAGETTMIKWFKEGKDIHIMSALKKYHLENDYDRVKKILDDEDDNDPEFKVWKVRRKQAKTINFGIIYGQGANKLAESLECSVDEAKQFLKEFDKTFPKVASFVKKQHKLAQENAYVKSVFGRKRRLPNVDSDEKWKVAEALRFAVNAPIQGAASDYALFSSILIWEKSFYKKGIKTEKISKDMYNVYLEQGLIPIDLPQVYTVHDSLGFFVRPHHIHEVVPILKAICANPETNEWFGFQIDDVTMKVDFEVSHENWGELKTYRPEIDYTQYF